MGDESEIRSGIGLDGSHDPRLELLALLRGVAEESGFAARALKAWRSMRDTFLMEDADEVRRFYVAVSLVSILCPLSKGPRC